MKQTNPPYLILQKWNRILNTSNPVACALDNIGSKCKIMYRFKISASAGMTNIKDNNDFDLLTTYNLAPCVQPPHLWVRISLAKGRGKDGTH